MLYNSVGEVQEVNTFLQAWSKKTISSFLKNISTYGIGAI